MSVSLAPHPWRKPPKGPVVCVVMDGIGIGSGDEGDAVASAHTPTLDWLRTLPSAVELRAHGTAVGMPSDKDMGNSEVGHNVLGGGRVFDQGAKLVNAAIRSRRLFEGTVWREAVAQVRSSGQPLHLLGLLSDGNVHSHIDHLIALLHGAAEHGVKQVRVHTLLDGRDVPERSALTYIDRLEQELTALSNAGRDYAIASGGGRMRITMDRYEADWDMVARGWDVHVRARAREFASAREAIETFYAETDDNDQYLRSFVVARDGAPLGPIRDGAAVILFNFRGDRAIEISRAFEDEGLTHFDRSPRPDVQFAGMMQYDGDLLVPKRFLVEPPEIEDTMGELLVAAGRRQLAISETQKFGHVTYFWNGNRSGKIDDALETYIEVPSDRVPFEQRPRMKAAEITDALLRELDAQRYDFVRVNYANGDMVGHSGEIEPTRVAVETIDACLSRLVAAMREREGVLLVTADHGNAEQMIDRLPDGGTRTRTSHTLNPVPLCIYDPRETGDGPALAEIDQPQLANVAATCLELLGFEAPELYAQSLLSRTR